MDLTLQRYKLALTNQAYGIVLVSEEEEVEFVNRKFCEVFGLDLSPDDLVGLKTAEFLRIIAPSYADPTGTLDRIKSTVAANVQQVGDHALMRDGRTILVDYTPIVLDGKPCGRMWQIRDITEVRQAQEALRQSEEKFSTAFQTSPYAISITRMDDGGILEVNDAFVSILGYSREELVDQTTTSIGLLVDKTDRDSVVLALRDGQVVAGRELRLRKKNGEIITSLLSAQAVDLSQGRCIMSSADDITARKQAALELQSKSRFLSDLIEHSGTLICVKDRDGRYELVNKRWEKVTGLSREDVIGKTDADLFPGPIAEQFRSNDLEVVKTQAGIENGGVPRGREWKAVLHLHQIPRLRRRRDRSRPLRDKYRDNFTQGDRRKGPAPRDPRRPDGSAQSGSGQGSPHDGTEHSAPSEQDGRRDVHRPRRLQDGQ